jgi:hypothetical protein
MSNFEPLPPQPDWREEQYSPFPLPGEAGILQPFEQATNSNTSDNHNQQSSARPQLEHRHSLGPLRQEAQPPSIIERPDSAPVDGSTQVNNSVRDESLVSSESTVLSLGSLSNPLSSASSAPTQANTLANNEEGDSQIEMKEEEDDDDEIDDDDMADVEEVGGSSVTQTAAERRAERRKMKRFR